MTAALLAVAIGVVYYLTALVRVVAAGEDGGAESADAIVVLGAAQYDGRPSPVLAGRLDTAYALFRDGRAGLVAVTGGKAPGDRFTEAEASITYLRQRGVPAEAILAEDRGRTTWESLRAVAPLLESRGVRRILVVSSPYHVLRSRSILTELGFTASGTAPPGEARWDPTWFRRVAVEAAGVAAGELVGYRRLESLNP